MADRLVEIGAADLAFTSEEIVELLRPGGVCLSQAELARLEERTQGWVAAVLIASSLTRLSTGTSAITSARDWNGEMEEFLGAEILDKQPPEIRRFMMRTCIVDSVCAGLGDALTGRSDGEAALLRLQQAHLLGGRLDESLDRQLECLRLFHDIGDADGSSESLERLAMLANAYGAGTRPRDCSGWRPS
jgi:LuxR family maltose regulon positive regulatory protein